jgi:hypothetical protein
MLAAVGGLVYTLSTLLKLQAYFGYLLPLPVVVAAMRNGPAAGRRTMSATAFLLLGARPPLLSGQIHSRLLAATSCDSAHTTLVQCSRGPWHHARRR